jgi:hypothetical protein
MGCGEVVLLPDVGSVTDRSIGPLGSPLGLQPFIRGPFAVFPRIPKFRPTFAGE